MEAALALVAREVEAFVAREGWDQPARLFAIVHTAQIRSSDPRIELDHDSPYTSVEQELEQPQADVEMLLATLAWPPDVVGAALVIERIVLPEGAEGGLPTDSTIASVAASHPLRSDVRMVSAVLRDGTTINALRFKSFDDGSSVAVGSDLVPSLNAALLATFD
mgnify:CR=1 FL=1